MFFGWSREPTRHASLGPQAFQGVLAASEAPLKLPARARVWRGWLRVIFVEARTGPSDLRLGSWLGTGCWARRSLATLNLASAGALWRSPDSPVLSSQLLGLGAKVRVRLLSSAWATAAAVGAEVERPCPAKDERLGLAGPTFGGPAGNYLGSKEPGSTLWSLQGSGG